jgi:D-amino-acid oxidase
MADAIVIGSGVSGLTTAVSLAEAGLKVVIWTAEPPYATTSAAAGAMWGPYHVEPQDKVLEWSRRSLAEFTQLANDPSTGVRMTSGIEAARHPMEEPPWADLVPDMSRWHDLPEGFVDGFRFTVPLIDMPVYLSYLEQRFIAAGGSIEIRAVSALAEATSATSVVVNCAGLGASTLVPDEGLRPIRGQIVVVENPGIEEFFSEDTGLSPELCCVYPHGATVVLGGTAEDDVWEQRPDSLQGQHIVNRCAAIIPALGQARVISQRVGLRPTRASVKVEEDGAASGSRLIHNYGHGGAGVTLSWGCADTVTSLVDAGQR